MLKKENMGKLFWIILLLIFIILSVTILTPFFISILSAILIAFFFRPLDNFFQKKLPGIASRLLILFLFILIVFGPLTIFSLKIVSEGMVLAGRATELEDLVSECFNEEVQENLFCSFVNSISQFRVQESGFTFEITSRLVSGLEDILYTFTSYIYNILFNIPIFIFYFFITLFISYFLLRDGDKIYDAVKDSIPLKKSHYYEFISSFKYILKGILYGNFLTALLQGLIAFIVFLIFGFDSAIFWGFVVAVIAFIPMVGAFFGWLPIILYNLITGLITSNSTSIIISIVLLIISLLITLSIDNIIRPVLIGEKGNLHPLLVFLGVFGGITFIGPIGLFYGPFILQVTVNMINSIMIELTN